METTIANELRLRADEFYKSISYDGDAELMPQGIRLSWEKTEPGLRVSYVLDVGFVRRTMKPGGPATLTFVSHVDVEEKSASSKEHRRLVSYVRRPVPENGQKWREECQKEFERWPALLLVDYEKASPYRLE